MAGVLCKVKGLEELPLRQSKFCLAREFVTIFSAGQHLDLVFATQA